MKGVKDNVFEQYHPLTTTPNNFNLQFKLHLRAFRSPARTTLSRRRSVSQRMMPPVNLGLKSKHIALYGSETWALIELERSIWRISKCGTGGEWRR